MQTEKKKKNVGKGHAFAVSMPLFIGNVSKQIHTFYIYQFREAE